jgi:hypothetical protein
MRIAKVLSAFVGVIIVIGSLGIVGAGAVALSVNDTDGYLTAGPVQIATDSAALVGDDLDIFLDDPIVRRIDLDGIGARIEVNSRNGKPVFVGIGPSDEVTRYLADVRHGSVEFRGDEVVVVGHEGTGAVVAPRDQAFWVADAGDSTLSWEVDNGRWAIAVLNADGTPGVDVEVTAAVQVPFIRSIGIALIVAGLLGLVIGVTFTYLGVRSTPNWDPVKPREEPPVARQTVE